MGMPKRAVEPTEAERTRQSGVLQALVGTTDRTQLAAAAGLSYSQLSRYISGETLMPSVYYGPLAKALGIARDAFIRQLLVVDEPDIWTVEQFRQHLEHAGLPNATVDDLAAIAAEQPALGRRSLAEGYVRLWQRRRTKCAHDGGVAPTSDVSVRLLTG